MHPLDQPDERLVFFDLETGGGEIWRPIIQVAMIAVRADGDKLETYEAKLRIKESLADQRTLKGSRYCRQRWFREAQSPLAVANAIAKFLERHATIDQTAEDGRVFQVAQLVAHNAAFDGEFLKAWFGRMRMFLPASPRVLCTVQRAMWAFHEHKHLTPPVDFKLKTLCDYFHVPLSTDAAHDALNDAYATVGLYQSLLDISTRVDHGARC